MNFLIISKLDYVILINGNKMGIINGLKKYYLYVMLV